MSKHMKKAIRLADTSRCRYRHGCVIVLNGRVVGEAVNRLVSDQTTGSWRKSHMHAEIAALLSAGSKAYGAIVYVARVHKDGTPADSKPCKKCEGQLKRKRVKKVIWT